jgi:hypothetical protein
LYLFGVELGNSVHFISITFHKGYRRRKSELEFRITVAVMMLLTMLSLFFYGMEITLLLNY